MIFISEINSLIPVTAIKLVLKSGQLEDLHFLPGTTNMMMEMWDKGIYDQQGNLVDKRELSRQMELYGFSFYAQCHKEYSLIDIKFLSRYFQQILDSGLLEKLLFHPAFPEKELDVQKNILINHLQNLPDQPSNLIWDQFFKRVFAGHPFGARKIGNLESIREISRESLQTSHANCLVQDNITAALISDQPAIMEKLQDFLQQKTPPGQITPLKAPLVNTGWGRKVTVLRKNGLDGSRLVIYSGGQPLSHPYHYSYHVLFTLFGEEVFNQIRSEKGIGYSVGAFYLSDYLDLSLLMGVADPVPDSTRRGMIEMDKIWQEFASGDLLKKKFASGKKGVARSYPFSLETIEQRLNMKVKEIIFNLEAGSTDADNYINKIEDLSDQNLLDALKDVNPTDTSIMVVAPPASGDLKIDGFEYQEIDEKDFLADYQI